MGALQLRPSSSVRGQRAVSVPATVGGKTVTAVLGGWRLNTVVLRCSRARRSRSTLVSTRRTSAPVPRSAPISCAIPICRPASAARTAGSIRSRSRCRRRSRSAARRGTASSVPDSRHVDLVLGQDLDGRRYTAARVPLGDLQPAQQRQLRSPEPDLRHGELRPDLQRQERARNATRRAFRFLRHA